MSSIAEFFTSTDQVIDKNAQQRNEKKTRCNRVIEIIGLLEEIHSQGNTIIVVTHEEDIAIHAHRIIRMMDGKIASDEINTNIVRVKDYQETIA